MPGFEMWNNFASQLDPNILKQKIIDEMVRPGWDKFGRLISPNELRKRISEEATKVNNSVSDVYRVGKETVNNAINTGKSAINKGLDTIYPRAKTYTRGNYGTLKSANPEVIANALGKSAPATTATVGGLSSTLKGGIGGGLAGTALGSLDLFNNWNEPGSDWRTRAIDAIEALGMGATTGLGTAVGSAVGHPVWGGAGGGIAGSYIKNKFGNPNADAIRFENLMKQDPNYELYKNGSMDSITNLRDEQTKEYIMEGIANGTLPPYALDNFYITIARRNAGISGKDIDNARQILKEGQLSDDAQQGEAPQQSGIQFQGLPPMTPEMVREIQAGLSQGNITPGNIYPNGYQTAVEEPSINPNDLLIAKFIKDYFGIKDEDTTTEESQGKVDKQEDDKMLEIVGKEGPEGGVVMMTPEEIAQARYQQENPLIAGGVEEEVQGKPTLNDIMEERLNLLNEEFGEARKKYDPSDDWDAVRKAHFARSVGMTPYSIWRDNDSNTRLKNIYDAISKEYEIRKDLEDRAKQKEFADNISQTFVDMGMPEYSYLAQNPEMFKAFIPYSGLKERITYPMEVSKEKAKNDLSLMTEYLKALGEIDKETIKGKYGLNKQDLITIGKMLQTYEKANTVDVNSLIRANSNRDIASMNAQTRVDIAKLNSEDRKILAKMKEDSDPNFNVIPNLIFSGAVSEEDARYLIDAYKYKVQQWMKRQQGATSGKSVTSLQPVSPNDLSNAFKGVK